MLPAFQPPPPPPNSAILRMTAFISAVTLLHTATGNNKASGKINTNLSTPYFKSDVETMAMTSM